MALKADSKYVDLHRGQEVWFNYILEVYWANVEGKYLLQNASEIGLHSDIDDTLDILYPPAPGGSILSQLFNETKAWVTSNIRGWVEQWGKVYENFTTYLDDSITYWTEEVSNYIDESINYWGDVISNVYNTTEEFITNNINNITEQITNVYNETTKIYNNTIGASIEWVNEQIAGSRAWMENYAVLMDPLGFLKDPLGFINTAFTVQQEVLGLDMVESFLEGFEEGLAEEIEG